MLKVMSFIVDGRVGMRMPETIDHAVKAIEAGVDVVSGQGNGTDSGPYYVGSDDMMPLVPQAFGPMLLAAKRTGTPFVFSMGSGGGADVHLDKSLEVIDQIARDAGVKLRIARISGEIDKDWLKGKLAAGVRARRSIDTPRMPEYLSVDEVDKAVKIQAQMGPEPIIQALEEGGIDGVITGRALDVGVLSAFPLWKGIPKHVAFHMAKVMECGGQCADPQIPWEAVISEVDEDGFTVRVADPEWRCSVKSVSTHGLYERENPFVERNPGGVLNVTNARYEQVDRGVRVTGSEWIDAPYAVKVEGAELSGFQVATVAGIRDAAMIKHLDSIQARIREQVAELAGDEKYSLVMHAYGRDAVMGAQEPLRDVAQPHEIGLMAVVTARNEEVATRLAKIVQIRLFAQSFPDRMNTAGNTATPFQKLTFPLGEAYAFNIWHLVPLDDPCEPFKRTTVELG